MSGLAALKKQTGMWLPLRHAWDEWVAQDAPIIGYLFKVLLASLLAMWLSLRFELDQPRTAMLTVAIVMQSRSGMVFAKSYYRLLGTLVGVLVSVLLVALFAQERVLFLLCMALWIGLCTAGSMIYRNHQSYAFVLAGYTLCIVGLPATVNPDLTFSISVTRISEILIGLFSATLVSDVIFPQRLWQIMLAAVRRRFADFSDLLRAAAENAAAPVAKPALLRFIGDIYSLETFSASAALENDDSRRHRQRLTRMNHEFMQVSTSFHALEQLLHRQRNSAHPQVGEALRNLYRKLAEAITHNDRSARHEQEAGAIVAQLGAYRDTLTAGLNAARQQLADGLSASERLDFETGGELLQRLAEEMRAYAATYAALADDTGVAPAPAIDQTKRLMHFDPIAVAMAGLRGALTLGVMASMWIFIDWRSGIEAITIGVISSTLFATTPSPTRTIKQFMTGAVIGTILAYFCNFHWLTQAQGFWMLALAVSPAIMFAAWLTTRPNLSIVGAGVFIVFLMHIGFNSAYSANPVVFINDAIADLLAVLVSGVMYGLIDISSSRWSRQRIATALRKLVVAACREPLALRRIHLETAARDLVQRTGSLHRLGEPQDRMVIDQLLATLEIGHAVIALREHVQGLEPSLQAALHASLESIAELHEDPSTERQQLAVAEIERVMAYINGDEARRQLSPSVHQSLLTMLHFINSALLDRESALPHQEG